MDGRGVFGLRFGVESLHIVSTYEENLGLEKINNLNFDAWTF